MSDKSETVLDSAEVKTTLSRSEQRKKNRQEGKIQRKSDAAGSGKPNIFTRIFTFFTEAKEELTRVVWPTRKETIDSTWRLLILVIIAGIYLGLVDSLLTRLLGLLV